MNGFEQGAAQTSTELATGAVVIESTGGNFGFTETLTILGLRFAFMAVEGLIKRRRDKKLLKEKS